MHKPYTHTRVYPHDNFNTTFSLQNANTWTVIHYDVDDKWSSFTLQKAISTSQLLHAVNFKEIQAADTDIATTVLIV